MWRIVRSTSRSTASRRASSGCRLAGGMAMPLLVAMAAVPLAVSGAATSPTSLIGADTGECGYTASLPVPAQTIAIDGGLCDLSISVFGQSIGLSAEPCPAAIIAVPQHSVCHPVPGQRTQCLTGGELPVTLQGCSCGDVAEWSLSLAAGCKCDPPVVIALVRDTQTVACGAANGDAEKRGSKR